MCPREVTDRKNAHSSPMLYCSNTHDLALYVLSLPLTAVHVHSIETAAKRTHIAAAAVPASVRRPVLIVVASSRTAPALKNVDRANNGRQQSIRQRLCVQKHTSGGGMCACQRPQRTAHVYQTLGSRQGSIEKLHSRQKNKKLSCVRPTP